MKYLVCIGKVSFVRLFRLHDHRSKSDAERDDGSCDQEVGLPVILEPTRRERPRVPCNERPSREDHKEAKRGEEPVQDDELLHPRVVQIRALGNGALLVGLCLWVWFWVVGWR